jgi:hypothetical protein
MLKPASVIVPEQLPPMLVAKIVFLMELGSSDRSSIAPPFRVALLPAKVVLVTVSIASLSMPPPLNVALLPEKVLFTTVSDPLFSMPPPLPPPTFTAMALLPERVLLVRVIAPSLRIPPPLPPAMKYQNPKLDNPG